MTPASKFPLQSIDYTSSRRLLFETTAQFSKTSQVSFSRSCMRKPEASLIWWKRFHPFHETWGKGEWTKAGWLAGAGGELLMICSKKLKYPSFHDEDDDSDADDDEGDDADDIWCWCFEVASTTLQVWPQPPLDLIYQANAETAAPKTFKEEKTQLGYPSFRDILGSKY